MGRPFSSAAALDVEEFLRTEVGAESGLRHGVVAELQGQLRGGHGVAAVGDVGERSAVDDRRRVLQRLHEVGLERLDQQRGHRALRLEVAGRDGLAAAAVGDDDSRQTGLEVVDVGSEAEHGHHFRSDGDVEAVLAGHAVRLAAEAADDVAQLAVVHVDAALPGDAARVDVERVALLDVIVEHGREQVVGRADGVEVAREVQVDVLHRHHLGVTAAGRAALDAEDRAERGLAQGDHDVLADLSHAVGQADRRRRLAFARGRGRDRRDEDQLAVGALAVAQQVHVVDLGLVAAVELQILFIDPRSLRHLGDELHGRSLGDLDVGLVGH